MKNDIKRSCVREPQATQFDGQVFGSDLSYPILNLSIWFTDEAIAGNLDRTLFRNCGNP